jgi:hypothetical protein
MNNRFPTSIHTLAIVIAVVIAVTTTVAARAQSEAAEWSVPKTPWGDPDLQGIYNYGTSTPLERPEQLSDRPVLSEEEAAALESGLAEAMNQDRRDGGAEADVRRNYNEAWTDASRTQFTADNRTSLIVDPPDGRLPPRVQHELTPAEQEAQAEAALSLQRFSTGFHESYKDADVGNRCIIRRRNEGGGHPYLPALYNNTAQIFQAPGYVVIYAEMIHHARIIPVDGRPHLPDNVETWLGNPVGRWEGDTLVIETTNFLTSDDIGRTAVVYANADPETFEIVERFRRVGPNTLEYEVTMSDPNTWTRPFTVRVPWNETDELIYEYQCQEMNYDLYYWLNGAREREARGERFEPTAN